MNIKESFTIKMHILFAHIKSQLELFGSIGNFTEDAHESIHSIINSFKLVLWY